MNSKALADLVKMTLERECILGVDEWAHISDEEFQAVVDTCQQGIMGASKEYERNGRQKFGDMDSSPTSRKSRET